MFPVVNERHFGRDDLFPGFYLHEVGEPGFFARLHVPFLHTPLGNPLAGGILVGVVRGEPVVLAEQVVIRFHGQDHPGMPAEVTAVAVFLVVAQQQFDRTYQLVRFLGRSCDGTQRCLYLEMSGCPGRVRDEERLLHLGQAQLFHVTAQLVLHGFDDNVVFVRLCGDGGQASEKEEE